MEGGGGTGRAGGASREGQQLLCEIIPVYVTITVGRYTGLSLSVAVCGGGEGRGGGKK